MKKSEKAEKTVKEVKTVKSAKPKTGKKDRTGREMDLENAIAFTKEDFIISLSSMAFRKMILENRLSGEIGGVLGVDDTTLLRAELFLLTETMNKFEYILNYNAMI
ncbi:MAG: hypothetical protein LBQ96_00875 [Fusobacteriaceae bacterium]|jgi:hypothetical protein|nr:hypothetical protein [Fusobacteriaceae bacterium]